MSDIIGIIDELQEEFSKGKNVFWSKKSLVNLDRCGDLIIELKRNLPTSIQEASYIISQKEKILERAKLTAEETIKEAEKRVETLINESSLVLKAEEEAHRIERETQDKCETMFNNTKNNIDKLLKGLEDYFVDNLHVVKSNREELAGRTLKKKNNL